MAAQALKDRSALAAIAVERTRMPMLIADARHHDNPIVLANAAFIRLSGYSAEEVIGRNCRFLQGPGTSPAAVAEIRSAVQAAHEASVEILNYRKDGSAFWNQLHISPIHDDEGQLLYFFASQVDVTELRRVQSLEASEHRLLREVDHRALNVLAIVNGIVRLSRSDDPALYAASVQDRVRALARAHHLLAEQHWEAISLAAIIQQQIVPYAAGRVEVVGPDVSVEARIVQPLALVLHELAVNAAVHGALSRPQGRVQVCWEDAALHHDVKLLWIERDGPAPALERRAGFGSTIIKGMVEKQLRGRAEWDWSPEGLSFSMSVPRRSS